MRWQYLPMKSDACFPSTITMPNISVDDLQHDRSMPAVFAGSYLFWYLGRGLTTMLLMLSCAWAKSVRQVFWLLFGSLWCRALSFQMRQPLLPLLQHELEWHGLYSRARRVFPSSRPSFVRSALLPTVRAKLQLLLMQYLVQPLLLRLLSLEHVGQVSHGVCLWHLNFQVRHCTQLAPSR